MFPARFQVHLAILGFATFGAESQTIHAIIVWRFSTGALSAVDFVHGVHPVTIGVHLGRVHCKNFLRAISIIFVVHPHRVHPTKINYFKECTPCTKSPS